MSTQKPVVREKNRLTRAKAERLLSRSCVDPTEERFTKHQNKHVRVKAARLAAEYGVERDEQFT